MTDLRSFEGPVETISSIYLVDAQEKLVGSVPLVSLALASGGTRLGAITPDHVIYVEANASEKTWLKCLISTTCSPCRWSMKNSALPESSPRTTLSVC